MSLPLIVSVIAASLNSYQSSACSRLLKVESIGTRVSFFVGTFRVSPLFNALTQEILFNIGLYVLVTERPCEELKSYHCFFSPLVSLCFILQLPTCEGCLAWQKALGWAQARLLKLSCTSVTWIIAITTMCFLLSLVCLFPFPFFFVLCLATCRVVQEAPWLRRGVAVEWIPSSPSCRCSQSQQVIFWSVSLHWFPVGMKNPQPYFPGRTPFINAINQK